MTKGKNRAIDRRIMRHREKAKATDLRCDSMIGCAARRGYRIGIAK